MTKHTPTPWIVTNGVQIWRDGHSSLASPRICSLANAAQPVEQLTAEEMAANAAFIVRAVNAHEELVAAARALLDRLDDITTDAFSKGGEAVEREALRAALAKAEG
jgi:hypothetical protein